MGRETVRSWTMPQSSLSSSMDVVRRFRSAVEHWGCRVAQG